MRPTRNALLGGVERLTLDFGETRDGPLPEVVRGAGRPVPLHAINDYGAPFRHVLPPTVNVRPRPAIVTREQEERPRCQADRTTRPLPYDDGDAIPFEVYR